jgi:hypothetical protein
VGIAAYDAPMSLAARSVVAVVIVALAAAALVVAVIGLSWAARSDELAAGSEGQTPRPSAPARTAAASHAPTPRPTAQALASGDATAVYAAFLDRVQADRSSVEAFQRALLTAIDDHDQAAIRDAALAIRAFVDTEEVWLDGHPPAACFADTHAAARGMLTSFGTAADRFVEWAAAGGGLNVGGAFGVALAAGSHATDAFDAFVVQLGETTCPA